jgi:hypothetical protein
MSTFLLAAILAASPLADPYDTGRHVGAGALCQFLGQAAIRFYASPPSIPAWRGNVAAAAACGFVFIMQESIESAAHATRIDGDHLAYDAAGIAGAAALITIPLD